MSASATSAAGSPSATRPSATPPTRRCCWSWASACRWWAGTRTSAPSWWAVASTSCASTTATPAARRTSPSAPRPCASCSPGASRPSSTPSPTWRRTRPASSASSTWLRPMWSGASMGGMIGQTLAARHREIGALARVDHVEHRQPLQRAAGGRRSTGRCSARRRPEREAFLDHVERLFTMIGSPGRADVEDLRELAALSYDRAARPGGHRAPARRHPEVRATAPASCAASRRPPS